MLPQHVANFLDLSNTHSDADFEFAVGKLGSGELGIFHSEAATEKLASLRLHGASGQVGIFPALHMDSEWRVVDVNRNGTAFGRLVHIPMSESEPPPTKAEEVLVEVWFSLADVVEDQRLKRGRVVAHWFPGNDDSITDALKKISIELCNGLTDILPGAESGVESPGVGSLSWQMGEVTQQNLQRLRLLAVALRERSIRWRFLQFYRVLENAYLENVLSRINDEFLQGPALCIDKAVKELEAEGRQLCALVERRSLNEPFLEFHRQFLELKKAGNQFSVALARSLKEDRPLKEDFGKEDKEKIYLQGALVCYKIRCAIVHAGGGASPFYEKYKDGDAALALLMPHLIRAVYILVGVSADE